MKKLIKIFVLGFLMGCAIGIVIPLSNVYLADKHVSTDVAGGITALYFLAMILGSKVYSSLIAKVQAYQIVVPALIVSAIATIGFVLGNHVAIWAICVFIIGIGVSFNFVTVQSCLNQSDTEGKANVTGIYAFFYAIGFAISVTAGPMLYARSTYGAFITAAGIFLLDASIVFIFRIKVNQQSTQQTSIPVRSILLCVVGGFIYGFIENAISAFYTIYLLDFYTLERAGVLLSVFLVGGMVGMIPLSYLSDKIGLRKSCLLYSIATILGMLLILGSSNKMVVSGITGAFLGSLYPITLAGLNYVGLDKAQLVKATAMYTMIYSFGSTLGPAITGIIMTLLGGKGLLVVCISLLVVFILTIVFLRKEQIRTV